MTPETPPPFTLFVDNNGYSVETSRHRTCADVIFQYLKVLDRQYPNDAPHAAWSWDPATGWRHVTAVPTPVSPGKSCECCGATMNSDTAKHKPGCCA